MSRDCASSRLSEAASRASVIRSPGVICGCVWDGEMRGRGTVGRHERRTSARLPASAAKFELGAAGRLLGRRLATEEGRGD